MSIRTQVSDGTRNLAKRLDKAVELGIVAAYPLVFNMPPPDDFDWKNAVRLGWRMVRFTMRETVRVIRNQWK